MTSPPPPGPMPAADTCTCGCDETDHGFTVGCVNCQCAAFTPCPSPAKNPLIGLWTKRNTSSGHFTAVRRSGDVFKGVRREN